jgi:hypothetical protein
MIRTVDQLLEGLESLILAALDELCTLDSQGVAQTIALCELQRVVTILEQHCDLDPAARARVSEVREMYDRIAEVSSLRSTMRVPTLSPSARRSH